MSDIQINITIQPAAANGKRKVIVSGAPDGEMPVMLTGEFPQLHSLVDQTYIALLKRKPQVVKVKAVKEKPEKDEDGDEEEVEKFIEGTDKKADQLDQKPAEPVLANPVPADLPVIEGDDEPQLKLIGD